LEGRGGEHDPRTRGRMGAAQYPRQRGGADLGEDAVHRRIDGASRSHPAHRGDDAAGASRRAGGCGGRDPLSRQPRRRHGHRPYAVRGWRIPGAVRVPQIVPGSSPGMTIRVSEPYLAGRVSPHAPTPSKEDPMKRPVILAGLAATLVAGFASGALAETKYYPDGTNCSLLSDAELVACQ